MLSVVASLALGNTIEVTTGDLRGGKGTLDNVKATFSPGGLTIGDFTATLTAEYDRSANSDFLKEATLSGDLIDELSYEVTHDFGDAETSVKWIASTDVEGYKVTAEVEGGEIEVSAEKDVELGDQTVDVEATWLVKAKTARVKLATKLDGGDSLTAEIDYDPDSGDTSYELSYDHNLEDGKDVSATLTADKTLEVDYVDTKFEDGATWTVSASAPTDSSSNILDAASISLKRAWTF